MSYKRKLDNGTSSKDGKKEKRWHVDINSSLLNATNKTLQQEAWKTRTSCREGDVELDCKPFPHCVINQFLQPEDFVSSLEKELLQLNFHTKSNDLYKFAQSDDLKNRTEPCITELRSVLFGQFRSWLSDLLDVELEPTVDISCAKYEHTDVLLCHDDELEGRRVAFILYLVPPWELSDGGTLDLFCTDEQGQPCSIVKSLVPSRNKLVFFEVSPVSFHQVSEILSSEKFRMSVSGWFHGPSLPRPPKYVEAPAPLKKYISSDDKILHKWISQEYMDENTQVQIQTTFQESSEICLKNFLQKERIQEVRDALQSAEIQWVTKGPANKSHSDACHRTGHTHTHRDHSIVGDNRPRDATQAPPAAQMSVDTSAAILSTLRDLKEDSRRIKEDNLQLRRDMQLVYQAITARPSASLQGIQSCCASPFTSAIVTSATASTTDGTSSSSAICLGCRADGASEESESAAGPDFPCLLPTCTHS
ncbi:hypothetical protein ACEWY4_016144 [Coilia grayii]|uniref:Prolyl 3-hydroxylase OGFOD1 n=1 Tax=Coilia grayii TaxID=363190 RepID=A0ABD1JQX2_9TELE